MKRSPRLRFRLQDGASGSWPYCARLKVEFPYLIQAGEVVVSFDQKWLVHPRVVNIVCCCGQQSQHDVQRCEEAGELLKKSNCDVNDCVFTNKLAFVLAKPNQTEHHNIVQAFHLLDVYPLTESLRRQWHGIARKKKGLCGK